jgi:protein tyrosine/serine phosphatase
MILLVVGLFAGAVGVWEGLLEERLIPKRLGRVQGHPIYRSGQLSASLVERTLAKYGIKVIVALTGRDRQDEDQNAEDAAAAALGIEVLRFPLRGDGTGDVNRYAAAVAAVVAAERQGKPVLVHCAAGAQRTGGVVAFYQLLIDRKSPAEVIQDLRRFGWHPKHNPALLPYLNANLAAVAALLHEQGLLDEIPHPLPVLSTP